MPALKRIIGTVILFAAVAAAFFWFYQTTEAADGPAPDVLRAVPSDAALILETSDVAEIRRDLSQSNVIWEELQSTDFWFRLNAVGEVLDSALRTRQELRRYFDRRPATFSVHASGANTHSYLMCVPLKGSADEQRARAELNALLKPSAPPEERMYDGTALTTLHPAFSDAPLTYFISEGILAVSPNALLTEAAVRALKHDARVNLDPSFLRVRKTTDRSARARIFVNHRRFSRLIKPYTARALHDAAFFNVPFGTWSGLDLTMRANAFSLNGFIHAADSSDEWLSKFSGLKAPEMKVLEAMPVSTAFFVFYGFGDAAVFAARTAEMREAAGVKYQFDRAVKEADALCNCDFEHLAASWIGDQAAAFITEPASTDYHSHRFAAFRTDNREAARDALEALEAAFAGSGGGPDESEAEHAGRRIYKLKLGSRYGDLLGDAFSGLSDPWAVMLDDYVVMGNALNGLRVLVQTYDDGKTLARDASFRDFARHISSKAHFTVYSALSRSPNLYEALLGGEHAAAIAERRETLRKFESFIYQAEHHKDGLYFNNIFFKHNPVYEQETAAVWESRLGAPVIRGPFLVKNHYTGGPEIVLQDAENRLLLLANTGKVLWEVKLDGPVEGEIAQVDLYKNRKLQMVFSTSAKLYVLDRNGNHVDGFPVSFSEKASAPVAVADYDNSRDYRFFIPFRSGKTAVYDSRGELVEGWNYTDPEAPLATPIEHIRVRTKDYLFAVNAAGSIRLLDRKGDIRHNTEARLPRGFSLPVSALHPEQVISSGAVFAADSAGTLYRAGFDGRIQKTETGLKNPRSVQFFDVTGDGNLECLIQELDGITAFAFDGKKLFTCSGEDLAAGFRIHQTADGTLISAVSVSAKKIWLWDAAGKVLEGFPLIGDIPAAVGDLYSDGNLNLVTGLSDGTVFGYSVNTAR